MDDTFPCVADIVPAGVSGNVEVRHIEVDARQAEFTMIRAAIHPDRDEYVAPGKYAQLFINGSIMMSDTGMERHSNMGVVRKARGRVLIGGLGLGMIIHPIAAKSEVESITIIEKSPDVIKLVAQTLPKKATVIEADIFEWKPPKEVKYDCLYFDIWYGISTSNLKEMTRLNRRFARAKAPGAWVDSWQRSKLLRRLKAEKKDPWRGAMGRCGSEPRSRTHGK